MIYTMLDLFAGVGGSTLAADSLGIQTTQFVEINPKAQLILRAHYPHIPIHSDIRDYWPKQHEFDIFWISFPCTGTSIAGSRKGLSHPASALWREALRCICVGEPRIVIVEQPEGFVRRGLRTVLGAMQMAGYTSEVEIISARELGAMHKRLRVFVVSYSNKLFPPNYSLPTRWSDTVREVVEEIRNSAQWLSVKRTSDRTTPSLPPKLVRCPIAVPNRYPGRLLSRQLAGNVVCPPQALVALKRAVYLLKLSEVYMTNTELLQEAINAKNMAYSDRNKMLVAVCIMAIALGCNAGIGKHVGEWEEDWCNIIFIDLPTGQVSWHIHDSELNWFSFLPVYEGTWDGHSTQEKWDRVLNAFSNA